MKKTIRDQQVTLDYREFEDVEFINCTIIYKGGDIPKMRNVVFEDCPIILDNEAKNTIQFLLILKQIDPDNPMLTQFADNSSDNVSN